MGDVSNVQSFQLGLNLLNLVKCFISFDSNCFFRFRFRYPTLEPAPRYVEMSEKIERRTKRKRGNSTAVCLNYEECRKRNLFGFCEILHKTAHLYWRTESKSLSPMLSNLFSQE